jgi:DNA-binding transcriptional LysR family regulator
VTTLRRDRLIVALPAGHRLAARRRVRVADLKAEDLVMHASRRSVMHAVVADLCRGAGYEPRVRHEVAETSTLLTFVAAGLGIAVVPAPVADLAVAGATYRPLSSTAGIDLAAAVRGDDPNPVLTRALATLRQLA